MTAFPSHVLHRRQGDKVIQGEKNLCPSRHPGERWGPEVFADQEPCPGTTGFRPPFKGAGYAPE